MSTLAVISYPEENTAGEAAAKLAQMQKEFLIDVQDVAWVTKKADGKLKLHQGTSLAGVGAAGGALWGFIFGLLFLVPLAGMAIGAATGAVAGKLSDFGIDDKWIKEVASRYSGRRVGALCDGPQHERRAGAAGDGQIRRHALKTNLTAEQEQALAEALSRTRCVTRARLRCRRPRQCDSEPDASKTAGSQSPLDSASAAVGTGERGATHP